LAIDADIRLRAKNQKKALVKSACFILGVGKWAEGLVSGLQVDTNLDKVFGRRID
jgi:hypothetical protein